MATNDPPPARENAGHDGPQETERRLEVHPQHLAPSVIRAAARRAVAEPATAHPDGVDDGVEPAQLALGLRDGSLRPTGLRDVDLFAVHPVHGPALLAEQLETRGADASPRPRH